MQINLVYDASVENAPAGFMTALNAAVSFLDNLFINPITVNIQVGWNEDQGEPLTGDDIGLGGPTAGTDLTYSQLRSDLAANATTATAEAAVASLPTTDPTDGGEFYVSSAQEKALGLIAANAPGIDGAVGFGGSVAFDFDPNDRAVPNEIDFIGDAEHELTHAMGRISGLQQDGPIEYNPLDLFRFAAPGTRQLGLGLPAYFSIDDGQTDLDNYDTVSDPADWARSNSGDSFDAVSYAGIANVVTQSDITEMEAIGFSVAGTAVMLTITGTEADQALIDQSTIAPFAKVRISDQNANQTETVTVTLSSAANGVLTNLGGGSYDAGSGVYTVSGSVAAVNAALEGLVFVPTLDQVAANGTVITDFTLHVTDTAGASATDSATSVVAVSSGSDGGGDTNLKTVPLASGGSFTDSGTALFGGAQVAWTGNATVTNDPSSLSWTAYSGTMAQEILAAQSPIASDIPSTQFTNPTLTALGLPFNTAGLALWGDPTANASGVSASDTIEYAFSSPAPAGTPFLLWAPGASANGDNGPDTFTFSAWLDGTPVSTAGWTFSVLNPFGATPTSSYSTDPATGQVIVRTFAEKLFPDAVVVVTPNTPVDALAVAASTIPFDFWGLAFPVSAVTSAANPVGPVTVTGVGGATLSLPMDTEANAQDLQPLLTAISDSVTAGTVLPALVEAAPTIPGGKSGLLQIDSSGAVALPSGYSTAIDDATGPVTITGGAANGQLVAAGKGGLTFGAGTGAGSVFAGGGTNVVFVAPGGGSQYIALGNGNDTISPTAGDDTIAGGTGTNLMFLGEGADSVSTGGNDTLVGGSGSATVTANGTSLLFAQAGSTDYTIGNGGTGTMVGGAGGSVLSDNGSAIVFAEASAMNAVVGGTGNATIVGGSAGSSVTDNGTALVFAGTGAMTFLAGAGNQTVVGSASGSMTLFGGSGTTLGFTFGPTRYIGGSGSDTLAGFSGQMTVTAGSGNGVFFGSPAGDNVMTAGDGSTTITGGGDGDVLGATGSGSAVLAAGPGAETINGAGSSGTNTFFGGSGSDVMTAGSGTTTMLDGTGADTMTAGSGQDLFVFTNGHDASVLIQDFVAGPDLLSLQGFGGGEAEAALAGATVANVSETIGLSDGTRVTFLDFTGLQASSFV